MLDQDATALTEALARGEITAEALMAATLARIAEVNPKLNAIVALRPAEDLMAEARAADQAPRKGWLHGVPVAVKDTVATKGLRTTMGSPILADWVPEADDGVAARLRGAGAIVLGKTNVPEFGLGSHSRNRVYGVTQNPYGIGQTAGGSSGGAGAALATRMVAVADGSDMMGSLRNPAGWNNIYSLRPSLGLITPDPAGDTYLHHLVTEGPMARSPRDLVALMGVLANDDPRHPFGRVLPDLGAADAPRRIGWLGDWGGAYPMEPGILDLCRGALEAMPVEVVDLPPPFPAEQLWESWCILRHFAIVARLGPLYGDPAKRAQLNDQAIWEIEQGLALQVADIQRASEIRSAWLRRLVEITEGGVALALPTAQVWPFPAEWRWPEHIGDVAMDTYHRWMDVVVPVSLIGLPAVTVPAGFGAAGLPMGLQIFGRGGSDGALLALAEAYHAATDWPGRRLPAL